MNSSTDYLDRLKGIREKYGCSQTKPSAYANDTYAAPQRNIGASYQKSDLYGIEKKKFMDPTMTLSTSPVPTKSIDYPMRPQSSLGIGSQTYSAIGSFSKQAERQRQIQQIRQNYAASRKKVIDDFSAKNLTRDFSKQVPKNYSKDYLKGGDRDKDYFKTSQKSYLNDYSKQRRGGLKDNETIGYTRSSLIDNVQQSVSPIKRMAMGEYDDVRKSYRQRQVDGSDTFWRQREAKLSQMTANRLNQNNRNLLYKDDKILDHKLQPAKRSGIYSDHLKTYGEGSGHGLSRMDLQNKPATDYSVSNIDRIQQRIQSILNKR